MNAPPRYIGHPSTRLCTLRAPCAPCVLSVPRPSPHVTKCSGVPPCRARWAVSLDCAYGGTRETRENRGRGLTSPYFSTVWCHLCGYVGHATGRRRGCVGRALGDHLSHTPPHTRAFAPCGQHYTHYTHLYRYSHQNGPCCWNCLREHIPCCAAQLLSPQFHRYNLSAPLPPCRCCRSPVAWAATWLRRCPAWCRPPAPRPPSCPWWGTTPRGPSSQARCAS